MDIKLKNYSHSLIIKIISFILIIGCFTGSILSFIDILKTNSDLNIISESSYYESNEFRSIKQEKIYALSQLLIKYKNEENILSGNTISNSQIEEQKNELFNDFRSASSEYNQEISRDENYLKFELVYKDKIDNITKDLIKKDLDTFERIKSDLSNDKTIEYYAYNGTDTFTNIEESNKEYFKSKPAYIVFDETTQEVYPIENRDNENSEHDRIYYSALLEGNDTIYITFDVENLNSTIKKWNEDKLNISNYLYKIIVYTVVLLISFIYLIIVLGRDSFGDKNIKLNFLDKIYTDVNLVICMGLIFLGGFTIASLFKDGIYIIVAVGIVVISSIGLCFVLSLFKNIKNKTLIKNSLVFKVLYKVYSLVKNILGLGSVGIKMSILIVAYPIIIMLILLIGFEVSIILLMIPFVIGLSLWIATKKIKQYESIKEGLKKIKSGEVDYKIDIAGSGEFAKLGSDINSISGGLKEAVEKELKSERLKSELITNVSHDIRTPLTSIITYVDLIKKENDKSKIDGYIDVIEQKANRLKILTDDLFEASKASSGNMPVNYEKIDIVALISQGLGELDDKIKELKLDFKINENSKKIYIKADGKLLWRAIENLLSNIFKYALKGSRVYIDIEESENQVGITIKNISAYELNIPANELMERFKRGDESRSSKGSGLGLSIAQSLIDIQNGSFNIEVDGDLFKAIIKMNKFEK